MDYKYTEIKEIDSEGITFSDGTRSAFKECIKQKNDKDNCIGVRKADTKLHGDITYVDEALYENKLSVVFEDQQEARKTLDAVREFIRNHPTVYCGTHTPQGYENLEAKRVMDLDNPVETIFEEFDFKKAEATGRYICSICGYVYDPAEHDGVAFEDLPEDWKCPRCRQPKEKFNKA